jgi:hypothetical protein
MIDWNRDGNYNQTIEIVINPNKLILKDETGLVVYPRTQAE